MHIKELLNESLIDKQVVFDKCLIVSVKLPNGFIIVESSACINPKDFDIEIGINICMKRIEDKLWELEGYKLHDKK
ncbi:MAG: Gp49 family protein [Carnobacterium sp.]|uniref:Gp49 family protein n=1 Tax=Carnobacterium sp. TaxID=48221 RepID=UPI003315660F